MAAGDGDLDGDLRTADGGPGERRNVVLYLIGTTASLLGDSAMILVAGIWVKNLTGDDRAAALTSVCVYAPSLLGPLAGVVVDRTRRRPLLVAVNLAGAALMLPLLAVRGAGEVWLVYVAMTGYGLAIVLMDPAESALFAVMLGARARQRFNGVRLTLQEGGKLVTPLLGAGLYTLLGGGAVAAVDAATFVVAALVISRLRVVEPAPSPERVPWRRELSAGVGALWRVPALRSVVLGGAAAMLVSGLLVAAQYALVDALRRPPAFLGVLSAALGAGSIVAGLASGPLVARRGERWLAVAALLDGAAGNALRAVGTVPAAVVGSAVLGFALPWSLLAVVNLVQRVVPPQLQGRAGATAMLLLFGPVPIAQAVGAGLTGLGTYRELYLGAATALLVTAVAVGAAGGRLRSGTASTPPSGRSGRR